MHGTDLIYVEHMDAYTASFVKHGDGENPCTFSIYDDDHDLCIFFHGFSAPTLIGVAQAIAALEPIGELQLMDDGGYVGQFQRNPRRAFLIEAMRRGIDYLLAKGFSEVKRESGWSEFNPRPHG